MSAEYITQIVRQLQYTALLRNLDVPMPEVFSDFLSIFSVLTIDPAKVLGRASLPQITFRIIFFLVGCCVPMIVNVLLLIIGREWHEVLWYFSLIIGFLICFVGILGKVLPNTSAVNAAASTDLAIIGAIVAGTALAIYLARRAYYYAYPEEDPNAERKKKHAVNRDDFGEATAGGGGTTPQQQNLNPNDRSHMYLANSASSTTSSTGRSTTNNEPTTADGDNSDDEANLGASAAAAADDDENGEKKDVNESGDLALDVDIKALGRDAKKQKDFEEWALKFHRRRTLGHLGVTALFIFAGLVLTGFVRLSLPGVRDGSAALLRSNTYFVVGIILLTIGAIALIYTLLNLCELGRRGALAIVQFLKDNLLRILIVAVLVTFIPIVSYCMDIYMCTTYDCPQGTVFNPHASRPPGSYTKDHASFCDACTFNSLSQPSCKANQSQYQAAHCKPWSDKRLFNDPTALCSDEGYAYVVVAATIVLCTFVVGVPYLFYTVTSKLTFDIRSKARIIKTRDVLKKQKIEEELREKLEKLTDEEKDERDWQKCQVAIRAVAGSIYSPFTFKMRYYNLYDLIQRFIFCIVLQVVAPFWTGAAALVCGGHVVILIVLLYLHPYEAATLQFFANLLAVANVLNSSLIVALWAKGDTAGLTEFAYVAIAVNAVIAVIGGAILAVLEFLAMGKKENIFKDEEKTATESDVKELAETATGVFEKEGETKEEAIEEALEDAEDKEEDRKKLNGLLEASLNNETMGDMSEKFMIMGVVISIAVGFCVLGILREPESNFHVGTNILYQSTADQIGGFATWDNFTQDCCCATGTTKFDDYNITERWICNNGVTVTRGRQSADGKDDGTIVRGICNTTFADGCVLTINSVLGRASVSCNPAASARLTALGLTETAKTLYW